MSARPSAPTSERRRASSSRSTPWRGGRCTAAGSRTVARTRRTDLRSRRDLLCEGLTALGLDTRVPDGTYFAVSDISSLGWSDADAFCRALPERAGVVGISLAGFYDSDAGRQLVRWAFCKRPEVLRDALDRLGRAELRAQ